MEQAHYTLVQSSFVRIVASVKFVIAVVVIVIDIIKPYPILLGSTLCVLFIHSTLFTTMLSTTPNSIGFFWLFHYLGHIWWPNPWGKVSDFSRGSEKITFEPKSSFLRNIVPHRIWKSSTLRILEPLPRSKPICSDMYRGFKNSYILIFLFNKNEDWAFRRNYCQACP